MFEHMVSDYWPANTRVQLCKVPMDNMYRDVVVFDTPQEKDAYFQSLAGESWVNESFRYLKPFEPVRVPIPYSNAYQYNYCVVTNTANPVPGEGEVRALYYFITGTRYVNPQVCELTLQLDVITTYQEHVELGSTFVESGHMGMSNAKIPKLISDLTGETLREYMTQDEGLNVGAEYAHVHREWFPLGVSDKYDNSGLLGRIIIVSTVNLAAPPGDVNNPNLNTADGQLTDGLPSGCNVYSMEVFDDGIKHLMEELSSRPWAAQGIVSISTFPGALLSAGPEVELFGDTGIKMNFLGETPTLTEELLNDTESEYRFETNNVFYWLSHGLYNEDGTDDTAITKMYSYPYSVIELTSWSGNSVFLKPELFKGNKIALYAISCALAPFARVALFPSNYNVSTNVPDLFQPQPNTWRWIGFGATGDENVKDGIIPTGDFLDTCLWLTDFPQFSFVNNNYLLYMANTANTRAYQYESAGWQQNKAFASAEVSRENAMANLANQKANYDASLNGLQGNIGNGITLGMPGAINQLPSAIGGGIGQFASGVNDFMPGNWGTNAVNNLTGYTQFANNQNYGWETAERNYGLATYAASGDYQNQIRGINAAYQDAQLTPPSAIGQMGGDGWRWKNGLVGFSVTYKQLAGSAKRTCVDFFRRYGYRINRWKNFKRAPLTALKVMSKFSYWKTKETVITCAYANETEKDAIRGVFEKGVTIWGNPSDIGNTDLRDNRALRNIEY